MTAIATGGEAEVGFEADRATVKALHDGAS
jgi:hypothetical protein